MAETIITQAIPKVKAETDEEGNVIKLKVRATVLSSLVILCSF
jgi:hypothetical protein